MYVLLCGYEIIPRGVSVRGGGDRLYVAEPICAYLLDTKAGWVLLDTGLDGERANDPPLAKRYFTDRGWTVPPLVRPAHSLTAQLAAIGLAPADVAMVALSHLHADHTGHLKLFAHAPVFIQRREHAFGFGFPKERPPLGWIPEDYDLPGLDWRLLDGDYDLLPGLALVSTPGHTAGHQSAVVTLPSGRRKVLTFDAGDFLANFKEELLPGAAWSDEDALASIRRLKRLAEEPDSELFPLHDPEFVQRARLAPDFYD